jgi:glycosyltransferase involved in cell wall biosynthesis
MSLSKKLRLESIVKWVGNTSAEALASEYNRADVFCLPGVQEGFGIVFLEAMAAGTNPDDPAAFADGVARLSSDRSLRERLSERAKREVQNYEMMRIARQFLANCDITEVFDNDARRQTVNP